MKARNALGILVLGAALVGALGLTAQDRPPRLGGGRGAAENAAAAGAFAVDAVHSSVIFKIQHMGVSNFYGRFNDISGSYTLDAPGKLEFAVKADSVDTNSDGRDTHLKGPDFFNAAEFPTISFKSTKVEPSADGTMTATGDLSLHGVTKPLTIQLTVFPAKPAPRGGIKSGLETTFTIKRSDFGMTHSIDNGGLSDEVEITVAIEGGKK